MYKHILLPTDGSELSGRAVKSGIELAKALRARVTGFYAAPEYQPAIYAGVELDDTTRARYEQSAHSTAETYLSVIAAIANAAGVPCEGVHVVSNSPAERIIQTAIDRGCDLIFMAPHGNRSVLGMTLGSNTNKVLTNSNIPVVVHR